MTRRVAGEKRVAQLVARLAGLVSRHNQGAKDLAFIGIKRRGVPLARRLADRVNRKRKSGIPVGAIDITLYRDDLQLVSETPIVRGSEIDFDINGRTLVLVDDVIFTGRTIRAALSELLDFGRPSGIQLAVLVDRGHRELPIQPDFAARKMTTRRDDIVDIYFAETDNREGIFVTRK